MHCLRQSTATRVTSPCKAWLAAAEALAGDIDRARLRLTEYAAMDPDMTVRRFAEERSSVPLEATSAVYQRESQRILVSPAKLFDPVARKARLFYLPTRISCTWM
jgi:hypothetical protein